MIFIFAGLFWERRALTTFMDIMIDRREEKPEPQIKMRFVPCNLVPDQEAPSWPKLGLGFSPARREALEIESGKCNLLVLIQLGHNLGLHQDI